MLAMCLCGIAALDEQPEPLRPTQRERPEPRAGQVLVEVSVCGVCRTELDILEGRTPPPRLPVVPGHQIVGRVVALGDGVAAHRVGDRVGIGWLWDAHGERENLDPDFVATGRDVDGGYAQFVTAPANSAFAIPEVFSDAEAAPLLCAGAVGYRALSACGLVDGEPLGLTGFGASAHLVLQMARHRYPRSPVFVFARSAAEREFARGLGAAWAGDTSERPPTPPAAIIDTTPAWKPVVAAMAALRPGGRLVINAIRKDDRDKQELLQLDYGRHLWHEREIRSVANVTRADIRDCLALAAAVPLRPEVALYPLAEANRALNDLARGGGRGAKVLVVR
ncbi:MAG: alcohol dehydrogenase catalytic domain-containing protein [Planctomycetes bacterium]|nr:alcohol dehydrogenase catalytic domain-containing protein [Planctomycetota bacterium]